MNDKTVSIFAFFLGCLLGVGVLRLVQLEREKAYPVESLETTINKNLTIIDDDGNLVTLQGLYHLLSKLKLNHEEFSKASIIRDNNQNHTIDTYKDLLLKKVQDIDLIWKEVASTKGRIRSLEDKN